MSASSVILEIVPCVGVSRQLYKAPATEISEPSQTKKG